MLSLETAKSIAAEHGITLCGHCENPIEIHAGFDHGKGECLIIASDTMLSMAYPDEKERREVIERVNLYGTAYEQAEQAELFAGSGI